MDKDYYNEIDKEFEKYVLDYAYSDTEELNDEHKHILKFIHDKLEGVYKKGHNDGYEYHMYEI